MQEKNIRQLLNAIASRETTIDEGLARLKALPFEDIGVACVDHHRELRQGQPEIIYGEGKSAEQISSIMAAMESNGTNLLVTRLCQQKVDLLLERFREAKYHADARCLTLVKAPLEDTGRGTILVVAAGTSDLAVASEALVTARFLGNQAELVYDVGVAGIHRLFARLDQLQSASVLIVVAGMEGALPSVVGGLVERPVIAVPTSVGYGAAFGGVAALLGMLNSCASGVTVVNIDNGFGAACAASLINRT